MFMIYSIHCIVLHNRRQGRDHGNHLIEYKNLGFAEDGTSDAY